MFIAWDTDVTFWETTLRTTEGHDDNILMNKLMRVQEYRDLYYSELRRAIDIALEPVGEAGTPWMETEIRRQLNLIDSAMREDPNKPYGNNTFDGARANMERFTKDRVAFIRCELERGVRRGCESVVGQ